MKHNPTFNKVILPAVVIVLIIGYLIFRELVRAHLPIQITRVHLESLAFILISSIILVHIWRKYVRGGIVSAAGPHVASLLTFIFYIALGLGASLTILSHFNVGLETFAVATGATALVVAIILSPILSNLVASGVIFGGFPVQVGDSVIVSTNNTSGIIESIGPLYTQVKTSSGALTIPNTALLSGGVLLTKTMKDENILRTEFTFKGDIDRLSGELKRVIKDNKQVFDGEPQILFKELDQGSLTITVETKLRGGKNELARSLILEKAYRVQVAGSS